MYLLTNNYIFITIIVIIIYLLIKYSNIVVLFIFIHFLHFFVGGDLQKAKNGLFWYKIEPREQ